MENKCIVGSLLFLFLSLSSLLPSSACPYCPYHIPPPPPPPPPHHKKVPCPPPPKPKSPPPPPPPPKYSPPPPPKSSPPPPPPKYSPPPPPKSSPPPPPPKYSPPPPTPKYSPPPPPKAVPCPPPPPAAPTCPIDTLKLSACVDLLGGLVHIGIGSSETSTCCPVLEGLADLDAALCLCTTIKATVLNINILLPIALEVLLDCGKHLPSDYQCPS